MLNSITLVGRLVSDPEVKELEKSKVSNITLAVNRKYKNEEGIYETDFIDCVVWNELATNIKEYCKKGDLVGITGRLQTTVYTDKEEKKRKTTEVIVEKLSFLSSKKETKVEE